jgi:hypothetical protein
MLNLYYCPIVNREHRLSQRQYAHTGHRSNIICIADAIDSLPNNFYYGILLHELGHSCDVGYGEEAANEAIYEMWGIRIYYVDSEYGKEIEWIKDNNIDEAKKILQMYIRRIA